MYSVGFTPRKRGERRGENRREGERNTRLGGGKKESSYSMRQGRSAVLGHSDHLVSRIRSHISPHTDVFNAESSL